MLKRDEMALKIGITLQKLPLKGGGEGKGLGANKAYHDVER